jgi:hypothetical protein
MNTRLVAFAAVPSCAARAAVVGEARRGAHRLIQQLAEVRRRGAPMSTCTASSSAMPSGGDDE